MWLTQWQLLKGEWSQKGWSLSSMEEKDISFSPNNIHQQDQIRPASSKGNSGNKRSNSAAQFRIFHVSTICFNQTYTNALYLALWLQTGSIQHLFCQRFLSQMAMTSLRVICNVSSMEAAGVQQGKQLICMMCSPHFLLPWAHGSPKSLAHVQWNALFRNYGSPEADDNLQLTCQQIVFARENQPSVVSAIVSCIKGALTIKSSNKTTNLSAVLSFRPAVPLCTEKLCDLMER